MPRRLFHCTRVQGRLRFVRKADFPAGALAEYDLRLHMLRSEEVS